MKEDEDHPRGVHRLKWHAVFGILGILHFNMEHRPRALKRKTTDKRTKKPRAAHHQHSAWALRARGVEKEEKHGDGKPDSMARPLRLLSLLLGAARVVVGSTAEVR